MSAEAAQSTTLQPRHYPIPEGVHVELDERNRQWTNIDGAAVIAGKSRRTIHAWMAHGWVVVRRGAGGRPQILVASLWQSEEAQ